MSRTRAETRARARALQALYACDMRGGMDLEREADRLWADLDVAPTERERATALVHAVVSSHDAIDRTLTDVTTNWRLERLGAVERSVLRLGTAELLLGDTPVRVVLQEGVRLAERYGSAQSARFVNGVLDAIARRMGRL